jgi:hypothetical protein
MKTLFHFSIHHHSLNTFVFLPLSPLLHARSIRLWTQLGATATPSHHNQTSSFLTQLPKAYNMITESNILGLRTQITGKQTVT